MTALPGPIRWLLLLVLATTVVLMHHAPAEHGPAQHEHHVAAIAHHSGHDVGDHSAPMPGGHDPLHLCLAIAAALFVLLLPRLRFLANLPVRLIGPARGAFERTPPPPPPLPRRLAELCVLRR